MAVTPAWTGFWNQARDFSLTNAVLVPEPIDQFALLDLDDPDHHPDEMPTSR